MTSEVRTTRITRRLAARACHSLANDLAYGGVELLYFIQRNLNKHGIRGGQIGKGDRPTCLAGAEHLLDISGQADGDSQSARGTHEEAYQEGKAQFCIIRDWLQRTKSR